MTTKELIPCKCRNSDIKVMTNDVAGTPPFPMPQHFVSIMCENCGRSTPWCQSYESAASFWNGTHKSFSRMTAEECLSRIEEVLSRNITISDGPEFHVDGSSTSIIFPEGKETLGRLIEIANIIRKWKGK